MKRSLIILVVSLFCGAIGSVSQTLNVPQDYLTIQAAIDYAEQNDTILVDNGTYFENINFKGKNIVVCSNYAISGNLSDISSTIIDGSMPQYEDTASCVLIVSGEDSTAVLQGFTITGGKGTKWEDEHGPGNYYTEGGGILIQMSSPTIRNNIITANEAINDGPGILSAGGGAIRCGDGNPQILNNVISYNQGLYGGGIVMNYSGAIIKNNIIFGNSGGDDYGGGGLWILQNGENPLIIDNNTIAHNHSKKGGGGIRFWSTEATLTNNVIWANTAVFNGQIQGSATLTYSCVQGGFDGEGNIDEDPGFTEVSFLLSDTSSCIDSGNPISDYYDPEDPLNVGFALFPSRGELHSDMGAYGGPGSMELTQIITSIKEEDEQLIENVITIYPIPAMDLINIKFSLQSLSPIEIEIVDTYGKSIMYLKTLFQENLSIDISSLKDGIYLLKCKTVNKLFIRKIIKE